MFGEGEGCTAKKEMKKQKKEDGRKRKKSDPRGSNLIGKFFKKEPQSTSAPAVPSSSSPSAPSPSSPVAFLGTSSSSAGTSSSVSASPSQYQNISPSLDDMIGEVELISTVIPPIDLTTDDDIITIVGNVLNDVVNQISINVPTKCCGIRPLIGDIHTELACLR